MTVLLFEGQQVSLESLKKLTKVVRGLSKVKFHRTNFDESTLVEIFKRLYGCPSLHKLSFHGQTMSAVAVRALAQLINSSKTCLYNLTFKSVYLESSAMVAMQEVLKSVYLRRLTLGIKTAATAVHLFASLYAAVGSNRFIQCLHLHCHQVETRLAQAFAGLLKTTSAQDFKFTDVSVVDITENIDVFSDGFSGGEDLHLKVVHLNSECLPFYMVLLLNAEEFTWITLEGLNMHDRSCAPSFRLYFELTANVDLHRFDVINCVFDEETYSALIKGICSSSVYTFSLYLVDIPCSGGENDITLESITPAKRLRDLRLVIDGARIGACRFYRQMAFDLAYNKTITDLQLNLRNFEPGQVQPFLGGNTRLYRLFLDGCSAHSVLGMLGGTRELVVGPSLDFRKAFAVDMNRLVFIEMKPTPFLLLHLDERSLLRHLCLVVDDGGKKKHIEEMIKLFVVCRQLESVHIKSIRENTDVTDYFTSVVTFTFALTVTYDSTNCHINRQKSKDVLKVKLDQTKSESREEHLIARSMDKVNNDTPLCRREIIDAKRIIGIASKKTRVPKRLCLN